MLRLSETIYVSIFSLFIPIIIFLTDFSLSTLIFLLAVILHELSHLLCLGLCGVKTNRICIYPFGIDMECDMKNLFYGKELLCVLSGSGANLIFALLGNAVSRAHPTDELLFFVFCNLFLGVCNLLPVPFFDGGRAFHILADWIFLPHTAFFITRVWDFWGFILSLIFCFFTLDSFGFNLSLTASLVYGFIANITSERAARTG